MTKFERAIRTAFLETMVECGGDKNLAAECLGISISTLNRWLKKYDEEAAREQRS